MPTIILNRKIKLADFKNIQIRKNTIIKIMSCQRSIIEFQFKSLKKFRKKIRLIFGKKNIKAQTAQWYTPDFTPDGVIFRANIVAITVGKTCLLFAENTNN